MIRAHGGYCDDLLKQIDDKYCKKNNGKTYDYNLRNYTTSHVHMMLSTALTEMIDNTECIMFYNTPNSVSLVDDLKIIKGEGKKATLSHWIYHELAMMSLVRRHKPNRTTLLLENVIQNRDFSEKNNINIEYGIDKYLENLIPITSENLKLWREKYANLTHKLNGDYISNIRGYENVFPLDVLYYLLPYSNRVNKYK